MVAEPKSKPVSPYEWLVMFLNTTIVSIGDRIGLLKVGIESKLYRKCYEHIDLKPNISFCKPTLLDSQACRSISIDCSMIKVNVRIT